MNQIKEYNEIVFEEIKHIDENGNEYWYARELQVALEYTQWRNFELAIKKAKKACNNSDILSFVNNKYLWYYSKFCQ